MSKRNLNKYEDELKQGLVLLEQVSKDTINSRNIRRAAIKAVDMLNSSKNTPAGRASNVVSILDEILQDPNLPPNSRIRVWNIKSLLEEITD